MSIHRGIDYAREGIAVSMTAGSGGPGLALVSTGLNLLSCVIIQTFMCTERREF
jgi:hypothetical protein